MVEKKGVETVSCMEMPPPPSHLFYDLFDPHNEVHPPKKKK
eukprot:CAMPEP_0119480616 /NCGR_PEP_ID=MMETSP1344-20130328/9341_1 /TAXON_ID=236787 /ORGANISM="Florenciella parvula, Strain CCMP2471" /LENGTH=40 /DNA_ID= /DNA_START= /DNA_END= /DNA_ORIENTATION=